MPANGACDLGVCGPLRHPRRCEPIRQAIRGQSSALSILTCADAVRQLRSLTAPREHAVPAHVTIQESWRSSIIRAPGTTVLGHALSSGGTANLVFDGIDQLAEPGTEGPGGLAAGRGVAFEDAELARGPGAGLAGLAVDGKTLRGAICPDGRGRSPPSAT